MKAILAALLFSLSASPARAGAAPKAKSLLKKNGFIVKPGQKFPANPFGLPPRPAPAPGPLFNYGRDTVGGPSRPFQPQAPGAARSHVIVVTRVERAPDAFFLGFAQPEAFQVDGVWGGTGF